MKSLTLLFLLFVALSSQSASAQSFSERFEKVFDANDVPAQQRLLNDWEKATPDDPELFVAFFNHHFAKSRRELVTLSSNPGKTGGVKLTRTDDGKTVAYLGSRNSFEKEEFDKAISYLDKGIAKFPNRLDMRFGKTYALGQIEDYGLFTAEIVKTIEFSAENNNQWLWMKNKPVQEPRGKFLLSAIQDYIVQIFDAGDENLGHVKTVAESVLRFYPDNIENLSNLGVYYLVKQDFDNALIPLLKAEKIAPTDFVVLNNIAFCYFKKNDKTNAVRYYELVKKHGTPEARTQADEKLKKLKEKP